MVRVGHKAWCLLCEEVESAVRCRLEASGSKVACEIGIRCDKGGWGRRITLCSL